MFFNIARHLLRNEEPHRETPFDIVADPGRGYIEMRYFKGNDGISALMVPTSSIVIVTKLSRDFKRNDFFQSAQDISGPRHNNEMAQ